MRIAVEGCLHSELDKVYETISILEKQQEITIDLLLCCGDFQSVRNNGDLHSMAVPPKYRLMGDFHKYYSGEKVAPILTVFIGGNHEASSYLQELPYGGWVAKNIYYMGYAGIIQIGGIRIGGLSGIYKAQDYNKGHYEHPPYTEQSKRSAYHIRNLEVFRLKQINKAVDIFLSHDWPAGITNYGDVNILYRRERKEFLRQDIERGVLGSPPAMDVLMKMKPTYWFSAHLHCKFPALIQHQDGKTTKFLALDKCLPRRKFLQVIEVPNDTGKDLKIQVDAEWLTVLKNTNHLLSLTTSQTYMPGPNNSNERFEFAATEKEIEDLTADFGGLLDLPENFAITAPVYNPITKNQKCLMYINPQTTLICQILELTNPYEYFQGKSSNISSSDSFSNQDSDNISSQEEYSRDNLTFIDSDTSTTSLNTSKSLLLSTPTGGNKSLELIDESPIKKYSEIDSTPPLSTSTPLTNSTVPHISDFTKKRSSLLLPQPSFNKSSNEASSSDSSFSPPSSEIVSPILPTKSVSLEKESTPNIPSSITKESCPSITNESLVSQEVNPSPIRKKLKRRNESFYSNTDEN